MKNNFWPIKSGTYLPHSGTLKLVLLLPKFWACVRILVQKTPSYTQLLLQAILVLSADTTLSNQSISSTQAWEFAADQRISVGKKMSAPQNKTVRSN